MEFCSPFQKLHVGWGVKADIYWWHTSCVPWNGVCLLVPSLPSAKVYTDANGRKGIGGVYQSHWFSSRVPCRYHDRDIQFKEAFAILHAILPWGDAWAGHHVSFYCDNQAVVRWLTSGTCCSAHLMPIVWLIPMMAACLNFSFSCVWIPSEDNALTDTTSCSQFTKLLQLAPLLGWTSSPMKSHLTGLRRMLIYLDAPPSTSGMGWHQALGNLLIRSMIIH